MRKLGIDYGTKYMGVSISDPTNTIGRMLITLRYQDINMVYASLNQLMIDYPIDEIVLGEPLNMNGSVSKTCEKVYEFKEGLEERFDLPVILIDERLTSVIANNTLISNNTSREKRKKVVDGMAAVIILQTYLDRCNNGK